MSVTWEEKNEWIQDNVDPYQEDYWIIVFEQDVFMWRQKGMKWDYSNVIRQLQKQITSSWIDDTIPINYNKYYGDRALDILAGAMGRRGWDTSFSGIIADGGEFELRLLVCMKRKIKRVSVEEKIIKTKELILSGGPEKKEYELVTNNETPIVAYKCAPELYIDMCPRCFPNHYTVLVGTNVKENYNLGICFNRFEPKNSPWHCKYTWGGKISPEKEKELDRKRAEQMAAIAKEKDRYSKRNKGIIMDTKTNLEWIAGPDRHMNWYEAKNWVKDVTLAGGGWRMPTIKELKTLYREDCGQQYFTPLLKITGGSVWSGEDKNSSYAWFFDFIMGNECGWKRNRPNPRAFAVRSRSD